MKKIISTAVSALLVLSLAGCSGSSSAGGSAAGKFKAGTYTGTADGKNGPVTVEVVLSADKIESVTVKEHSETAGISDPAIENLPGKIVEAQSTAVDGESGATVTSDAIKAAVDDALAQAGYTGGEEAPAASAQENVPVTYTAGTYTGAGTGYNGPISVDVTFGADKIESIEVKESGETEHVGTLAYDIMIPDMIEANGSGVDTVSGATFSSAALKVQAAQVWQQLRRQPRTATLFSSLKKTLKSAETHSYPAVSISLLCLISYGIRLILMRKPVSDMTAIPTTRSSPFRDASTN